MQQGSTLDPTYWCLFMSAPCKELVKLMAAEAPAF